jgi:tetratricopeptide (TPR) repeat protein
MTSHLTTPCPDHETLAAFIDGRSDGAESRMVREHLASCPQCLDAVTTAVELAGDSAVAVEPSVSSRWRSLQIASIALAAAALLLFLFLGPLRQTRESDQVEKLIAAAGENATRTMDGRLAAASVYRPYGGVTRGGESPMQANARLREVAGWVQNRGSQDAEGLHALGVSHLLLQRHDTAVQALDRALREAETPAQRAVVANDLSVALLARAARNGVAADASRARQIMEGLPQDDPAVAWNRAIAAEQLRDDASARTLWQDYLRIDPASPWADEARRREARLR